MEIKEEKVEYWSEIKLALSSTTFGEELERIEKEENNKEVFGNFDQVALENNVVNDRGERMEDILLLRNAILEKERSIREIIGGIKRMREEKKNILVEVKEIMREQEEIRGNYTEKVVAM